MIRTKAFKYQREGIRQISHFNGRVLLADEMGLGKTFQSLRWMEQEGSWCWPAVVVCPASLKWNWEREALLHANIRGEVLEGRKVPRFNRAWASSHKLLIINYDILGAWLPWIMKLDPQLVMLDECQYIKNREAQRTRHVRELCKNAPYVIGMSGTPLTNRPAELWPILNILLPHKYESFMPFAHKFCQPKRKPWGWEFKGATNLDLLHRRLRKQCMIRRLKKDVLKDLPEKTRSVVPLQMSATGKREYQAAERDFLGWLRKQNKRKAKKAAKAEALVKWGYLKRLAAMAKLDAVFEWVDNFLDTTDGKLVLFGIHTAMLKPIYERYHNISVVVNGKIKGRRRQAAVDKFQSNKKTRLFIGNMQAAGVGLTLTAASTCCFVELGWTPGEHTQAEDRIHRIGQRDGAQCFYLVSPGTVEDDLCEVIQTKQEILASTLDGKGGDVLDIFSQLEHHIKRRVS